MTLYMIRELFTELLNTPADIACTIAFHSTFGVTLKNMNNKLTKTKSKIQTN